MAINIKGADVKGVIEVDDPKKGKKVVEVEAGQVCVLGEPAKVCYSVGYTHNLGNYESVKVHVSLTMPCEPEAEAIEDAYIFCDDWVSKKLEAIKDELTSPDHVQIPDKKSPVETAPTGGDPQEAKPAPKTQVKLSQESVADDEW